jgi:hypothetical protein
MAFLRTFVSAIGVALMGAVLIGYGVVSDIGLSEIGGSVGPEMAKQAGRAFTAMFALQAAALAVGLAFFLMMEERPLRGPAPSAAALAE